LLGGRDGVLDGDALGVLGLGVVVEGRALEALRVEARLALEGLLPAEHVVVGRALVEGEDVVGDHAEPDHERAAPHIAIDGDQEAERFDEVRGHAQEPLTVPQ
jgi:hypothetical protein